MLKENEAIILAKVAERAERYDEMADFMKVRVECGENALSAEERDLFSAAFKGSLTGRRHALRVAVSIETQETADGHPDKAEMAAGYRSKVEAELQQVCTKALDLLQENLVSRAESG